MKELINKTINAQAEKYKGMGFNVIVRPEDDQLPEAFKGLKIDVLATKPEKIVLVNIRHQKGLTDTQNLAKTTKAAKDTKLAQHLLIVLNPLTMWERAKIYFTRLLTSNNR